MPPRVLYFLLCHHVSYPAGNRVETDVHRLMTRICLRPGTPFPVKQPELCVAALFTGGQGGQGTLMLRCVEDDTKTVRFRSGARLFQLPHAPDEIWGWQWRLTDCPFCRPGLHWIELLFDGAPIAQAPLYVVYS